MNILQHGHYAKIEWDTQYNQYVLKKSKAEKKDQSYFLYGMPKEILSKVIFPLSDFNDKTEIRKIAEDNGLIVAHKKDSQEICFIQNDNYVEFLKEKGIKEQTGEIILKDGTILGKHNGLINYTVGQRKGIGIAYPEPLYVLKLDTKNNKVIVGTENDLYSKELYAKNLQFLINNIDLTKSLEVMVKIRYRANPIKAIITFDKEKTELIVKVNFEEPQRAITPRTISCILFRRCCFRWRNYYIKK